MKKIIFPIILSFLLLMPAHSAPRPGGVFENTVETLVFSGQRRVIRGRFSKNATLRFESLGGQNIPFQVTKIKRKKGKTRLTYLIPSIGINDVNGDSITSDDDSSMHVIDGRFIVTDNRIVGGLQEFDMMIYIKPNTEPNSVTINTRVNGVNDAIYAIPKLTN